MVTPPMQPVRPVKTAEPVNELAELLDFHGVVHAGDVLVVEAERPLSLDMYRRVAKRFEEINAKFGVRMILLGDGFRVADKKPT